MVLVTRSSMPDIEEYVEEISDLWGSHWLTNMGVKHQEFEGKLKKYLGVRNLELFTNGHMALELAIQALDLNGEIITTPYTFASTTHAIVRNNCKPVFCDINPKDFTIDVNLIEGLITKNTVAILPVHVYGNICNIEVIDKLAKKYNLKVIYDAAHAFGETYNNIGVGNFGDMSMFSFHATKVFNTIEGGALTFNNSDYSKQLYKLKNFGIKNEEIVDGIGCNAKMNEFCAAMGICNLRHVDTEIEKRRNIFEMYIEQLSNISGIQLNVTQNSVKSNYSYFPILIDKDKFGHTRDDLFDALSKHDIVARKYFYPITNTFDCYKDMFDSNNTPIALEVSKNILTLPLYADLDTKIVHKICEVIRGL